MRFMCALFTQPYLMKSHRVYFGEEIRRCCSICGNHDAQPEDHSRCNARPLRKSVWASS